MKKRIALFLAILITWVSFAQNGINYKAIIKDNNGNVLANDLVVVQFTILQGVAQSNVYQESHTPTTDANGLIIVNIGEGIPLNGNFTDIDWAADTTFLNTQINTGTGLVDMGTTEFKTVPYALFSAKSADSGWGLNGNAGTDPNTNFIGTTDNVDLVFKRNNQRAGLIASTNISFGKFALNPLTTGSFNSAFGSKRRFLFLAFLSVVLAFCASVP
jgi:hypothetical protein